MAAQNVNPAAVTVSGARVVVVLLLLAVSAANEVVATVSAVAVIAAAAAVVVVVEVVEVSSRKAPVLRHRKAAELPPLAPRRSELT